MVFVRTLIGASILLLKTCSGKVIFILESGGLSPPVAQSVSTAYLLTVLYRKNAEVVSSNSTRSIDFTIEYMFCKNNIYLKIGCTVGSSRTISQRAVLYQRNADVRVQPYLEIGFYDWMHLLQCRLRWLYLSGIRTYKQCFVEGMWRLSSTLSRSAGFTIENLLGKYNIYIWANLSVVSGGTIYQRPIFIDGKIRNIWVRLLPSAIVLLLKTCS